MLQADINSEKKILTLLPTLTNDKSKLNELTKSYTKLEIEYIKLKQELKNKKFHSHSLDIDEDNNNKNKNGNLEYNNNSNNDDDNNNYGLNFGNNNNLNKQTRYENSDENHILIEISLSIWCMLKLNRIIYKLNKNLGLVAITLVLGKLY